MKPTQIISKCSVLILLTLFSFANLFAKSNSSDPVDCSGDVTLSSQAEVDNCDCTEIGGSLTISGADITDLTPLNGIVSIGEVTSDPGSSDGLIIYGNDNLTVIDGFNNIVVFGNYYSVLRIEGNPLLTTITGFEGHIYSFSIDIKDNPLLENIEGLSAFESYGYLGIVNNDALINIDALYKTRSLFDEVTITDNESLINVYGLRNLIGAEYQVEIKNNPSLVEFCGLFLSMQGGGYYPIPIVENNGIEITREEILANGPCHVICEGDITLNTQEDVDDCECNEITGTLTISGDGIRHLTPLLKLSKVGYRLRITDNTSLNNLDGLVNLSISSRLNITDNPMLSNINGLSGITSSYWVKIKNNNSLWSLDGLENLQSVGGVEIANNDALTNIKGLSALEQINKNLSISQNDNLMDLDGLLALTSVGRNLKIHDNGSLNNLDGLRNLANVGGDLKVYRNATLMRCCGLHSLLSSGTVGGRINIWGNESGCTINDILANGPCLADCGDVLLSSQADVDNFECTVIRGSLTISGADIIDLTPLNGLTSLDGGLRISDNDNLVVIDGFEGQIPTLNIYIENNPLLENIDGLSAFEIDEELVIINNDALTNIDPFNKLLDLRYWLYITENDALTNLSGLRNFIGAPRNGVDIWNNSSLTEFCGLYKYMKRYFPRRGFSIVNNGIEITQEEILENGPCSIICEGDVALNSQSEVNYCDCTEIIGTLTISGDDIYDLYGLLALREVGYRLVIENNVSLQELWGLQSLTTCPRLNVKNNPRLSHMSGLSGITSSYWVEVKNNSSLWTLDGLTSLRTVGGIRIENNDVLNYIDGLSGLGQVNNNLSISQNDNLIDLDGLQALTSVRRNLKIHENSSLNNIDGLKNLASVGGDLKVYKNTALMRCCGLYPLLSSGTVGGNVKVWGNGAGCTRTDILADGACNNSAARKLALSDIDQTLLQGAEIVSYELGQNYPNPTWNYTIIPFSIPEKSQVSLTIYHITGIKMIDVPQKEFNAGHHEIEIEMQSLPAGMYFYRMQAGDFQRTMSMMVEK